MDQTISLSPATKLAMLASSLFWPGIVHSAEMKTYRVTFREERGLSAESHKNETLERLPSIYARQLSDVEWEVEREGKVFFVVRLEAVSAVRIRGWLSTLEYEAGNSISHIREIS